MTEVTSTRFVESFRMSFESFFYPSQFSSQRGGKNAPHWGEGGENPHPGANFRTLSLYGSTRDILLRSREFSSKSWVRLLTLQNHCYKRQCYGAVIWGFKRKEKCDKCAQQPWGSSTIGIYLIILRRSAVSAEPQSWATENWVFKCMYASICSIYLHLCMHLSTSISICMYASTDL